jgi:hypothetical protein
LIIKNLISCLFCEQTTRHISKRKNLKYPNWCGTKMYLE